MTSTSVWNRRCDQLEPVELEIRLDAGAGGQAFTLLDHDRDRVLCTGATSCRTPVANGTELSLIADTPSSFAGWPDALAVVCPDLAVPTCTFTMTGNVVASASAGVGS